MKSNQYSVINDTNHQKSVVRYSRFSDYVSNRIVCTHTHTNTNTVLTARTVLAHEHEHSTYSTFSAFTRTQFLKYVQQLHVDCCSHN